MIKSGMIEELKSHMLRWRGSWVSKLTPELRAALEATNETDMKRAASVIIHGPAPCKNSILRRVSDGWKFCHSNGKCPCFMEHFHKKSEETNMAKRGVKNAAQAADVKEKMKSTCLERYGVEYSGASAERQKKAKQTNLEKYGVENVFASDEVKQKIHDVVREKYGVDHISQSSEHRQKIKDAVLEKYGVDHVMRLSEIRDKVTQTNIERYGGVAPACSEDVRKKMKQTMLDRYGVTTPLQNPETKEKFVKTNMERYGAPYPAMNEDIRQKNIDTNREKFGVDHPMQSSVIKEKFRKDFEEKHGVSNPMMLDEVKRKAAETNLEKYGYSSPMKSDEVKAKISKRFKDNFGCHPNQTHIAEHHRIKDEEDFRNRFAGRSAFEMAKETGYHVSSIYKYATDWNVELDYSHDYAADLFGEILQKECGNFLPNQRVLGDGRYKKEIDFFFPDKFGVEFCGIYWHSDVYKNKDYHLEKYLLAKKQGIFLIQFFQDEWDNHPIAVMSSIKYRLGLLTTKIHARRCIIEKIDHTDATLFYDINHVYGGASASLHLALKHEEEIVACMSFTERRPRIWELVRYATSVVVSGGASKLLSFFEKNYQWEEIISFSDNRWSDGSLYYTLGFNFDKEIKPDYSYVVGKERLHKFNLRKSSRYFEKYEGQNLTESQMAELEGFHKIYDAGKIRFVKKKTR